MTMVRRTRSVPGRPAQVQRGSRHRPAESAIGRPERRYWRLGTPFLLMHVALLGVVLVGWSEVAVLTALLSYLTRAFGITAFFHRCFAHRSFRVPRVVQLLGAILGAAAAQRGPLWWAAHHRQHHRYTDRPGDPHSPAVDGFWYSHFGWVFDPVNGPTQTERVADLARYPELRFLDRHEYLVPGAAATLCFAIGASLDHFDPGSGTNAWQLVIWGFVVPTVALYHSTFSVNSLAHRFGTRRFDTPDASRNNWLIAVFVLGEGWHNNHHRFPNSARQGLSRLELDPTWWAIRAMEILGLATAVRRPTAWLRAGAATPKTVTADTPGTCRTAERFPPRHHRAPARP